MKKLVFVFALALLADSCKKKEKDESPEPVAPIPADRFHVLYNGNGNTGGDVPFDGKHYDKVDSALALGNTGNLVKKDFAFTGWNNKPAGDGVAYTPGSPLIINNSDVSLYAQWVDPLLTPLRYIRYFGNGKTSGTEPVDNTSYVNGSRIVVAGNTGGLARNGDQFRAWNTDPDGIGQDYFPGDKITAMQSSYSLYAIYNNHYLLGKFFGFNISGHVASKYALNSPWIMQDAVNTFGANLVEVVWDGYKLSGFDKSGYVSIKHDMTYPWSSEDNLNSFGADLVCVAWNGSQYVGFDINGYVAMKTSFTSPWSKQDAVNSFGSDLVDVVWNGSKYVGFDKSGKVATKASLTSPWSIQDNSHTIGSDLVCVAWNGSGYFGFDSSGRVSGKSSLTSPWLMQDANNNFTGNLVSVVYK